MATLFSPKTAHTRGDNSVSALESAEEAIITLKTLARLLSPEDRETLLMLMDSELMSDLDASLIEAADGKYEPIESILA